MHSRIQFFHVSIWEWWNDGHAGNVIFFQRVSSGEFGNLAPVMVSYIRCWKHVSYVSLLDASGPTKLSWQAQDHLRIPIVHAKLLFRVEYPASRAGHAQLKRLRLRKTSFLWNHLLQGYKVCRFAWIWGMGMGHVWNVQPEYRKLTHTWISRTVVHKSNQIC